MVRTGFTKLRTALRGVLIMIAACLTLLSASAAPVTWTLQGVTFNDGGTASGSFSYDAVAGTYSSINITTTAGTAFSGATYLAVDPGNSSTSTVLRVVPNAGSANAGTAVLALFFSSALTSAGGTVALSTGLDEGTCNTTGCTSAMGLRSLTGGSVSTVPPSATPIPSSLSLLGVGLFFLAGWSYFRRRPARPL